MRWSELLIQMIFGWPMIIVSILFSIVGVWLKKPALLVTAGVIALPFAAYMTAAGAPGLILPAFHFGSAYAVKRERTLIAWLLIVPMMFVAVFLAYAVLTQ